jgi:hypothetical protein
MAEEELIDGLKFFSLSSISCHSFLKLSLLPDHTELSSSLLRAVELWSTEELLTIACVALISSIGGSAI